jgi:hypothetical protein
MSILIFSRGLYGEHFGDQEEKLISKMQSLAGSVPEAPGRGGLHPLLPYQNTHLLILLVSTPR